MSCISCTFFFVEQKHCWPVLNQPALARGRILGRNPDKSLKSHLYSFFLRFLLVQTHATSYSFYSSVTVHGKGERRKTWQKAIPPSLWFKKSIQKPQVWALSRLCPETSTKLYVHEFGFWPFMRCTYCTTFLIVEPDPLFTCLKIKTQPGPLALTLLMHN